MNTAEPTTIGLDGDDTLWHNETIFQDTQAWYRELLAQSGVDVDTVHDRLIATERRNLTHFGYGIKGFSLSLIETGIELTGGALPNAAISEIIERARLMIGHPTEVIDGVADTLETLRSDHRLLLITKGDLLDQEAKVARSGLADYFDDVHIVTHKDPDTYRTILARHQLAPRQFVMVGNSLPSDVLPVLQIGGRGVHIPYHVTWELETVAATGADNGIIVNDDASPSHLELDSIRDLPAAIADL